MLYVAWVTKVLGPGMRGRARRAAETELLDEVPDAEACSKENLPPVGAQGLKRP